MTLQSQLSVLVVDNESDNAESQAAVLHLHGHAVRVARDGPSALREIQDWRPDVVLLDLGMPKMSGFEVAKAVVAMELPRRPFLVALTGCSTEDDRRQATEVGFDLFLLKPTDQDVLLRTLRHFREQPPGTKV